MEEQFILRVPLAIAEHLNKVLEEESSSGKALDMELEFEGHNKSGREGNFLIGGRKFAASLVDLPCVVESWKTFDDNALVKTADIGQMIVVRHPTEPPPESIEYRHGLTPPMREVRKKRFRREPDLNPEIVEAVEADLRSILAGGTAKDVDVEVLEQEEEADEDMDDTQEMEYKGDSSAKAKKGNSLGKRKMSDSQIDRDDSSSD